MLELLNSTVRYGSAVALDDVSLRIEDGERIALCGRNGAGKSTLLLALLAAACKNKTRVPQAVFVPQELPAELDLGIRAHDYVMLGRTPYLSAWRRPSPKDEIAVAKALDDVGMSEVAARKLGSLSGGERRRLAIALALASEASVLLLDESMAHLDVRCRAELFKILLATRRTIVMAVHDSNLPEHFFTRVISLESGRIVET